MQRLFCASIAVVLALSSVACGAKKEKPTKEADRPPAYLTVETAGPDFKVQGEYSGESKDGKMGAQVVALGDGKFEAVILHGGLPGDGYDGKPPAKVPGDMQDGKAMFSNPNVRGYALAIADGVLKGESPLLGSFELKRVERKSPTEGAKPPAGATVLFDGTGVDAWKDGKIDERKLLAAGTETKKDYQSFTLHAEFLLPFKPLGRDQDRGNSGIYIQKRYEIQVLDTFGHGPEFNGCASVYRQKTPALDLCYPPLQWQTYDIDFQAAQFDRDDGKKIKNASITVKLNGVVVQENYDIIEKTGAGSPEGPTPGPILLQQHNNPVFYRNIWIVEK